MLQGFLKLILYGLLAYILYTFIRIYQSLRKKKKHNPSPKQISGMMVKDEMCNTYLPKEDAIEEIREGKSYYFCSQKCRQKFLEQSRH